MASITKTPAFLTRSINRFSTTTAAPFPSFKAAKAAIISESNPEKLAEIFEKCAHVPAFYRHRPIYHLSIRKLARANRLDLIDRVLKTQMIRLDDSAVLKSEGFWVRLVMLYSNAGMYDHAHQTLDELRQRKYCVLSEKSLCALLTAYLNNGLTGKVHECFETMPKNLGVEPGIVSHNLVLKAFVKDDKLESARDWIEKMENTGKVKPNSDSYNSLLAAYLKKGDLSQFDELVKGALKRGLECNPTTYNLRISRLCKSKECARAKKLLDEMISKSVRPNSATYNTIIDGFCWIGDFESANKMLEKMMKDGYVSPCSLTYYTMIRSMVKEGDFDSALEMCTQIMRRKWVPPFEAMEGLVKGLVNSCRTEEAKQVVEKMKKRLKGEALQSWGKIEAALPL